MAHNGSISLTDSNCCGHSFLQGCVTLQPQENHEGVKKGKRLQRRQVFRRLEIKCCLERIQNTIENVLPKRAISLFNMMLVFQVEVVPLVLA